MNRRRRRTKIIATLGPATDSREVLESMMEAGLDAVRINCSFGEHSDWLRQARAARTAAGRLGRPIAVLMDLQGPKIRLAGNLAQQEVSVGEHRTFTQLGHTAAREDAVAVVWDDFLAALTPGRSEIAIGDGLPRFTVESVTPDRAECVCVKAGTIAPRRGLAVTHAARRAPALTAKDLEDLDLACELEADFVALSFVRSAEDVRQLRTELDARGCAARVMAKIEKAEACDDLEGIADEADALMVARGDLGVEAGVAEVPLLQKRVIREGALRGKLVVTATQMLDSMTERPEPTRAEATNVANAVIDGTGALMLSAETASGAHPVEAVEAMAEIARAAEGAEVFRTPASLRQRDAAAVMKAAYLLGADIDAGAYVIPTETGGSARAIAKFRPRAPIIALCHSEQVARQLALEWGVIPRFFPAGPMLKRIPLAIASALELVHLPEGMPVVVTCGPAEAKPGTTNLIVVRHVGADD